jgi:hypothetical protein
MQPRVVAPRLQIVDAHALDCVGRSTSYVDLPFRLSLTSGAGSQSQNAFHGQIMCGLTLSFNSMLAPSGLHALLNSRHLLENQNSATCERQPLQQVTQAESRPE